MTNSIKKYSLLLALVLISDLLSAQSASSGVSGGFWMYILFAVIILVLFFFVFQVSDNLIAIEAKKSGADQTGANLSIFPSWKDIFAPRLPEYVANEEVKIFKRGFDIKLEGAPKQHIDTKASSTRFAVQPKNFTGLSPIPKMEVQVGNEVMAGDPLFFDKKRPEVKFVAPVSGEVIAINRGAKRSIAEVVILADKEIRHRQAKGFDLENGSREELVAYLLESGLWPMIRQRPFNVIPAPEDRPRDIFISTFDSAPLAPDANFIVQGKEEAFQKGLEVLAKLTEGTVYLGLNAKGETPPSTTFTDAGNAEVKWFHGKHPAGNVGVQIHHIHPIGDKDKVWTMGVQEVISFGQYFLNGIFDAARTIALAGAELSDPAYVETYLGANIGDLTKGRTTSENVRYVSGDVLSGQSKTTEEFLNFFDDQVTVLAEGDYYEMFGWLLPSVNKPTISRAFPNFLFPDLEFRADTNTHGEKRAFVVTGQYEKVLPMDIFPQHLMKAILVNDFERMEGLGIYELAEEDIALCEFVCTSKQPLQQILKEGLEVMREQG